MEDKQWYVLYVKANQEIRIESKINALDMEINAFCPTFLEIKQYSDRKKKLRRPFFKRMVFVYASNVDRVKVFVVPGTMSYLHYLGSPGIVRKEEIDRLVALSKGENLMSVELERLKPGDECKLNEMGFLHQEGVVQKVTNNHVWVLPKSMGYLLKVALS